MDVEKVLESLRKVLTKAPNKSQYKVTVDGYVLNLCISSNDTLSHKTLDTTFIDDQHINNLSQIDSASKHALELPTNSAHSLINDTTPNDPTGSSQHSSLTNSITVSSSENSNFPKSDPILLEKLKNSRLGQIKASTTPLGTFKYELGFTSIFSNIELTPICAENIVVYTDGGARPSSFGKMGWAYAITSINGIETSIPGYGYYASSTNNRGEMMAVLMALAATRGSSIITIFSDSKYTIECFTNWFPKWRVNGFLGANKQPVKNQDLLKSIDLEMTNRKVIFEKVKGHSNHKHNDYVDSLTWDKTNKYVHIDEFYLKSNNRKIPVTKK